jgi:hypothetical protein
MEEVSLIENVPSMYNKKLCLYRGYVNMIQRSKEAKEQCCVPKFHQILWKCGRSQESFLLRSGVPILSPEW